MDGVPSLWPHSVVYLFWGYFSLQNLSSRRRDSSLSSRRGWSGLCLCSSVLRQPFATIATAVWCSFDFFPPVFLFLSLSANRLYRAKKPLFPAPVKKQRTFFSFLLLSLLMPWWNKNTTVSALPSLLADYLVRWTFGVSAEGGSCSNIGFGAPVESKTLSSCLPFKGSWLVSQFDREGGGSSNKSAEGIFTPWQARKGVTCFRVAISSSLQLLKQTILKKIVCGIIRLYERFPSDWRDIIWYYLNNFVDDSDDHRDKIR